MSTGTKSFPIANRLAATLMVVAAAGCTDGPHPTLPSASGGLRHVTAYDDVQLMDVAGYMDVAQDVSISGNFPEWNGLDPAASALPAGTGYSCPNVAGTVMVLTSDKGLFIIAGVFTLEGELGYTRHGHPTARYRVPETQHYNTDRTYYIYGGYVDVECIGAYFNYGVGRVWIGDLHPFNYIGSGGPTGGGPTSGGSGGWAYKGGATTNGSSAGGSGATNWQDVLRKYLETGECTPGWKIFVDGVNRCTA